MFRMCDVGDVECWGCGMSEMWDVRDVGCARCGMWDVQDVRCSGCGMFEMYDVRDVGCLGCGMWDVGCLPGYGMLIYKMPRVRHHLQSFWRFAGILRKVNILICFNRWAEDQIFLKKLFSANTDIHRFLYSLIESIVFKLIDCMLPAFDFIANFFWKK